MAHHKCLLQLRLISRTAMVEGEKCHTNCPLNSTNMLWHVLYIQINLTKFNKNLKRIEKNETKKKDKENE